MKQSEPCAGSEEMAASTACSTRIASVVLNYNGMSDLEIVVPQLRAQTGVRHDIIIVDNASESSQVQRLLEWVTSMDENAVVGTPAEVLGRLERDLDTRAVLGRMIVLLNPENCGYSAGNNVGFRTAKILGAEAVLVANPDMRIGNPLYLEGLTRVLLADDRNVVAASRIIGIDGEDQNPLVEPRFWEEVAWPRTILSRRGVSYVLPVAGQEPVVVPKVSGCCMMLRMSFLQEIDYLDEGVFLYCEESILSARIRRTGGRILFVPGLSALHAHCRERKDNTSRRMLQFITSRQYYLRCYSGYGLVRRHLLRLSYALLALLHRIRQGSPK